MAVGTHWPAMCDVCGHVLPGQMRELRRGMCWWTGFQPQRSEQNVQFCHFIYCARDSMCVIRYDHLAMNLGPDVQEWKFNHRLWTSISNARICKRCSVNQTSFLTSLLYILISHWFFLAFWPAVCAAAHSYNAAAIRSAGGSVPSPSQLDRPEPDLVPGY